MIIAVVALARAGKDTFADYLVRNYDFKKINTSDVLRDHFLKKGIQPTKYQMSVLADRWRKESGRMDIVTLRSLEDLDETDNLVIIGLRSEEEIGLVKDKFKSVVVVSIMADPKKRFMRKNVDDPDTLDEFLKRDDRDIKNKGLSRAIGYADHVIENNSDLNNFYKQIDTLISTIKKR